MKRLLGLLILYILVGCSNPPVKTAIPPETTLLVDSAPACSGPTITFGDISDDPNEVISDRLAFVNYMSEHLDGFGIECGKSRVVDTVDKMIALIENGEVDIYMDSMFPATLVSDATGAKPILRRWRNCDPEYYSVIFTTKDSGITSINDIPGHMIAMDQPNSTSGFVLPAVYLTDLGLKLAVKKTHNEPVAENETGIFFSFDDKNTLNLVLEGKVSAGATDDYYFDKWEKEAPGKLVKLAQTGSVPRQVVLVRSDLDIQLQEAIEEVLLESAIDPAGLSALQQDADTCKYDVTPEGIEAAFEQMRQMHNKVSTIPGWQESFKQSP